MWVCGYTVKEQAVGEEGRADWAILHPGQRKAAPARGSN